MRWGPPWGRDRLLEMPSPVMGAEDFSYVAARVPAAMGFLGVCPPDDPNPFAAPACHSNRMVLHEESMATGVAMHAGGRHAGSCTDPSRRRRAPVA